MFRHIFIPTEENNSIPLVSIPKEWYNHEVEVIVFPVKPTRNDNKENRLMKLCGSWKSNKSAEDIIANIYNDRVSGKTRIIEKF